MGVLIFPEIRSNWAVAPTAPQLNSSGTQPSLGTTGKIAACFWRRRGQMCDFQIFMKFGSSGASAGTGNYNIDFYIPKWDGSVGQESFDQNWDINNFYLSSYPTDAFKGSFRDSSSLGVVPMQFYIDNSQPTRLTGAITYTAAGTYLSQGVAWSATAPAAPAAGDEIEIFGSIPIVGWT